MIEGNHCLFSTHYAILYREIYEVFTETEKYRVSNEYSGFLMTFRDSLSWVPLPFL